MASEIGDGNYLSSYSRFFTDFLRSVNRDDQLPINVNSYNVTKDELVGEIIHMTLLYLEEAQCPSSLQGCILRIVVIEMKQMCKKQPVDCGLKPGEKVYSLLKLMQAVTSKVTEICARYMDSSRLALLPPPPSDPLPIVTACGIRGQRRKMEDRHIVLHDLHSIFDLPVASTANYYAVFDGHGGYEAAAYSVAHLHQYLVESKYYPSNPERALRDAFLKTDAQIIEKSQTCRMTGGTTVVCALILHKKLYIAWVGDSMAALVKQGEVRQLVDPHKPERSDEVKRIHDMGGVVTGHHFSPCRVNGVLSVSRSLGDANFKPYISAEPEILTIDLDGREDFLILGCDGFFDHVDPKDGASLVYAGVNENPYELESIPKSLIQQAQKNNSSDNITVIVVFLTPPSEIRKRPALSLAAKKPQFSVPDEIIRMELNNPFLSVANGQYEGQYGKQSSADDNEFASNGAPDTFDFCRNNRSSNGSKHENGSEYDDGDLGPETDVDGFENVIEDTRRTVEKLKVGFESNNRENVEEEADDPPSPRTEKPNQDALITDADNVADSEDSEDEWNFYRVDPKKTKDTEAVEVLNTHHPEIDNKSDISDSNDTNLLNYSEENKCENQLEDQSELIKVNISEVNQLKNTPEFDNSELKQEETDDMEFQLNPDAKEFVPVSPSMNLSNRMNLMSDFPISGSPLKQAPPMDDIKIPSQREFEEEVCTRPSEIEDKDCTNGDRLHDFEEYACELKKPAHDESDLSSTRAEFGDESALSFVTASDYHRTGVSMLDTSLDYDISKDPMALSFTPGDFEVAFKKEVDLNAVHDISDVVFDEPTHNGNHSEAPVSADLDCLQDDLSADHCSLEIRNNDTLTPIETEKEFNDFEGPEIERQSSSPFEQKEHHDNVSEGQQSPDLIQTDVNVETSDFHQFDENLKKSEEYGDIDESAISPVPDSTRSTEELVSPMDNEEMITSPVDDMIIPDASNILIPEPVEHVEELIPSVEKMQISPMVDDSSLNPDAVEFLSHEESTDLMLDQHERQESMVEPTLVAETVIDVQPKESLLEFDNSMNHTANSSDLFELRMSSDEQENKTFQDMDELSCPLTTSETKEFTTEISEPVTTYEQVFDAAKPTEEMITLQEQESVQSQMEYEMNRDSCRSASNEIEEFKTNNEVSLTEQLEYAAEPKIDSTKPIEEPTVSLPEQDDLLTLETKEPYEEEVPIRESTQNVEKLEEVEKVETNESKHHSTLLAASAAAAVAVTTTASAAVAKAKSKPTSAKSGIKSSTTAKSVTKSTPTSPSKTTATGRTLISANKKTTATSTATRPKQLDTKTTSSAPKTQATKTTTTTTTTRTSLAPKSSTTTRTGTLSAKPKPTTIAATPRTSVLADKKLAVNGDSKTTTKSTVTKTTSKPLPTTTPRTSLVKSSTTTRTTTSATTATKARPSTATVSRTATKPASTTTTTARPKSATTTTTTNATKTRISAIKSPMTDKQIKDSANKQISQTKTSATTLSKSSRLTTTITTTNSATSKRLSTATAKSTTVPPKKSTPTSKVSLKTSSVTKSPSTKTAVTKTKIAQNEAVEKIVNNIINEAGVQNEVVEKMVNNIINEAAAGADDLIKKDLSPIASPTDNQLITAD